MTDRYQRHSLIDWFDQEKLLKTRVVVVGAGAVGNEVLKNLALLGVGYIHVFDFDKVEEHNLTRCVLFRDSDINLFKADVAAEACRRIDPNITIKASHTDFWDGLTLKEVSESDAVICCVDNFEARIRLNQLCLMTATDFYNTGIDSRYSTVEIYPFSTNPECACYECTLPPSAYITMQKRYSCGWLRKIAFEEKKIPTTAITSSVAGSFAASMMLNRINEHPQAIQGAVRHFQDSITLEANLSIPQRNKDCPACRSVNPSAEIFSTKRSCAGKPIIPLADGVAGEIVLSEPILIYGVCKLCGRKQEYFESARKLWDAVTFCSVCGSHSVATEFIERLTLADFEKMFAGRNVPCKFITYQADNRQVVIEMED